MRLPEQLLEAIQAETDKIERRRLLQAVVQLTERYEAGDFSAPAIANAEQRAAYLAVRFPATYAVNRRVFSELKLRAPQAQITTLFDVGAGPGTALFAAAEAFPELERATLLEADEHWLKTGKDLVRASGLNRELNWLTGDLRSGFSCEQHDLVVISYVLGELGPKAADGVIRKAWSCARQFLAVVEPGTPRGFAGIHAARATLIGMGAEIVAPCPHQQQCPMAAVGDWCHFSQRLERTAEHRQLKGGALGYEDEKFSYIIAGRQSTPMPGARIVRHPGKHSGHIELTLCSSAGQIERKTVTRSDKEAFRAARKAGWGDIWEE
jgi:ribosomal protein RSM22 (predicted rRNA methylase)